MTNSPAAAAAPTTTTTTTTTSSSSSSFHLALQQGFNSHANPKSKSTTPWQNSYHLKHHSQTREGSSSPHGCSK
jgi:hypothetical protein